MTKVDQWAESSDAKSSALIYSVISLLKTQNAKSHVPIQRLCIACIACIDG